MTRRGTTRLAVYLAAGLLCAFSLLPFWWMALTSVKADAEIVSRTPVLWPSELRLDRYSAVLTGGFGRNLVNSLVVAGATVVVGVAFAALAAYVLARTRLRWRQYLLLAVMTIQMFPLVVLVIPLYRMLQRLHLINTYQGLVVAYLAFTLPLAIYILRGFLAALPKDLEEAALVDGATRMGALLRIVLPLAGPGLAATAILAFITAWNEFLFALVFTTTADRHTLPVALTSFMGRGLTDWGMVMTASVLFTLPVIAFFAAVHRRLTTGLVTGATKG
jgi:ABC-type glycerol-3-phosphate transport system permease component